MENQMAAAATSTAAPAEPAASAPEVVEPAGMPAETLALSLADPGPAAAAAA